MKLSIVDRDKCVTSKVNLVIERRLLFSLSRFDNKIDSVTLTVRDVNGPKGGIDKQCQVRIKLYRGEDIVLSNLDTNIEACVSRLADRAARTLVRRVSRHQDLNRRSRFVVEGNL